MRKSISKTIVSLCSLVMLSVLSFTDSSAAAGSATLSFTPSATSVVIGNSVSVQIFENGTNVNVVTAQVTYDATKLSCNGVDTSTSAFSNGISATCGGGSATISRYTAPGTTVNGSMKVATLNFTATAQGSASMSFAASSQIASAGVNIWNGSSAARTITISAPVVVPPVPTPTPTPSPSPSPSPAPVPAPTTNPSSPASMSNTQANSSTTTQSATTTTLQNSDKKSTDTNATSQASTQQQMPTNEATDNDQQNNEPTSQGEVLGVNTDTDASDKTTDTVIATLVGMGLLAGAYYLFIRYKARTDK